MALALEKDIQRSLLDYLAVRRIFAWRNNTGSVISEYKGKTRMFNFGLKGSADIFALHDGIFYAIEVKRPGGKLTPDQEDFRAKVMKNGGIHVLATSLNDITSLFP